jgi:hypothetical protein
MHIVWVFVRTSIIVFNLKGKILSGTRQDKKTIVKTVTNEMH